MEKERCPLCNLKGAALRPYPRAVNWMELLLPCTSFDRATRDPIKGCRRTIPAQDHINACRQYIAEVYNPTADFSQAAFEPPSPTRNGGHELRRGELGQ